MRASAFSSVFAAVVLAASLTASLAGPSLAQPYGPPPYGRDGVQPLDRLLPGIRRAHPGDFYDAEGPTYGPYGDPHYHLKWMTPDGRVIWYDTDARNGRVLRTSPGRDSFDGPRPPPEYPPAYGRPYMGRGPESYGPGRNFGPGPGYARPVPSFEGGRGFGGGRGWGGGGRGDWSGGGRGRR